MLHRDTRSHRLRAGTGIALSVRGLLVGAGLIIIMTTAFPARAEKARSADDFVDSMGVNVHLHNGNTPYSNFPRVLQALKGLGIRHVRDGLIDTTWKEYYDRHNQLGRAGIKGTFITSPEQSQSLLLEYPRRMQDSFEAYEAPNEYDQSRDQHWAATLTLFVGRLNSIVKNNAKTARFPVIGPSFTRPDSFIKLRGVCSFDDENLHNYFAGRNPGTPGWGANAYGSLSWNLSNVSSACPGKPVITTETGYQTFPSLAQGIPEEVAAKYLPRLFLEQWLHGIKRTYVYELIDVPSVGAADSEFGLLRSDYSPKPAYSALMNLLQLLADPGPSFTAEDLGFKLTGDLSDVHHVLLQKRNKTFYLALWLEKPCYDVDGKRGFAVPAHSIAVQNEREVGMTRHSFDGSGVVRNVALAAGVTHVVEISDSITILEIDSQPVGLP